MISKIVFFGDSITAASRNFHNDLGNGYVSILKNMFNSEKQLENIQFINSGVNGHMVGDLLRRYQEDVLDHHPDAVIIMIGINDAYNDFSTGNDGNEIQIYHAGLEKLINNLQAGLPQAQFFLFTPYLITDSNSDEFYLKMNEYCGVVKTLGGKYALPVFDVQSVFNTAVKFKPACEWADDQIHPHREGHALIAKASFTFLEALLLKS